MRKTKIIIHHSATTDGQVFDSRAIWKYHVQTNGWADIGYHWILEVVDGRIWKIMGRDPDVDGAHCPDWGGNRLGYGICLVGNFDIASPSPDIWNAAVKHCKWLMREDGIKPMDVVGHREAQEYAGLAPAQRKTCPGKHFDMDQFRAELAL